MDHNAQVSARYVPDSRCSSVDLYLAAWGPAPSLVSALPLPRAHRAAMPGLWELAYRSRADPRRLGAGFGDESAARRTGTLCLALGYPVLLEGSAPRSAPTRTAPPRRRDHAGRGAGFLVVAQPALVAVHPAGSARLGEPFGGFGVFAGACLHAIQRATRVQARSYRRPGLASAKRRTSRLRLGLGRRCVGLCRGGGVFGLTSGRRLFVLRGGLDLGFGAGIRICGGCALPHRATGRAVSVIVNRAPVAQGD